MAFGYSVLLFPLSFPHGTLHFILVEEQDHHIYVTLIENSFCDVFHTISPFRPFMSWWFIIPGPIFCLLLRSSLHLLVPLNIRVFVFGGGWATFFPFRGASNMDLFTLVLYHTCPSGSSWYLEPHAFTCLFIQCFDSVTVDIIASW